MNKTLDELEKELDELEKNPQTPKKEINLTKCLISMIKDEINEIKNPKQEEEFHDIYYYYKPEYKKDGYFQSEDFLEKRKMFDEFVKKNNMNICREDYGKAFQIFLKVNFDIDWEWDSNKRLADEYKDIIKIIH